MCLIVEYNAWTTSLSSHIVAVLAGKPVLCTISPNELPRRANIVRGYSLQSVILELLLAGIIIKCP